MNKKIDIIIPAYKAHSTIDRTLSSIVIQSIKDLVKVTIVNDGDDQDYQEFINRYENILNIKEITLSKNGGPAVARQYGIDNTELEYITFIDSDDTFSGAFSLEILVKGMESNQNNVVAIGNFIEEQPDFNFITHSNDLIWMFGKLYKRKFLKRYNICFNDTRANEDNGFNTIVRLLSSETEQICFLNELIYYWHFKENSITRINNFEYSYNQSFIGYVDNMIYAIETAKKKKPFNGMIDSWSVQVLCHLYIYYMQTKERDKRFIEQNFKYCVKYYHRIYKKIEDTITDEIFKEIYSIIIRDSASDMLCICPDITIYEFIKQLKEENFNEKENKNG